MEHRHIKDLYPFWGSHPLGDEGDTEDSEWPVCLGLGLVSNPSDIGGSPTNPDMPSESSPEEEEILTIPLRSSTQNKRPHPHCHLCDLEIRGKCHSVTVKNLNLIIKTVMTYLITTIKKPCLCFVCGALIQ